MFYKIFSDNNHEINPFYSNCKSETHRIHKETYTICGEIKLFEREKILKELNIIDNSSDLYLVLILYITKGKDSILDLYGDFAFIIFNKNTNQLFFTRDLTSNNKIFYYFNNPILIISTNLNRILNDKHFQKKLNENKLFSDITNIGIKTNETYYKNTYFLKRREYAIFKNKKLSIKQNYQIPSQKIQFSTKEQYFEAFNEIFNNSIVKRLNYNDKIGIMLSGGLDSTSTAYQITNSFPNKIINTYTHIPKYETFSKHRTNNEAKLVKKFLNFHNNFNSQFIITEDNKILKSIQEALIIHPEPIRNAINLHWLLDINDVAKKDKINVLINTQKGNEIISWPSFFYFNNFIKKDNSAKSKVKDILKFLKLFYLYYNARNKYKYSKIINSSSIISKYTKENCNNIINDTTIFKDTFNNYRENSIFNENTNTFDSSFIIKRLDLSMDIKLIEFLYNIPQYFHSDINNSFIKQYLVYTNKIPNSIIYNNKKGLQSSDIKTKLFKEKNNIINIINSLENNKLVNMYYQIKNINIYNITLKDLQKIIFLSKF